LIGSLFGVDLIRIRKAKKLGISNVSDEELEELLSSIDRLRNKKSEERMGHFAKAVKTEEFLEHVKLMVQHQVRLYSIELREVDGLDAYPILHVGLPSSLDSPTNKTDVIQIVLNAMPLPDETTPWEQVIEYTSDPDSRSKFLALRNWMSEVARSELTPAEVEEKLEYLLDQFRQHMSLHRMKTNVGTLETVVTTTMEVLGDLASFKWGKAAEALFSLKHRQVDLLEGEMTAPGREVAYIARAWEAFNAS
jgi:hypothetical protein